jgi:hypothetical protein
LPANSEAFVLILDRRQLKKSETAIEKDNLQMHEVFGAQGGSPQGRGNIAAKKGG